MEKLNNALSAVSTAVVLIIIMFTVFSIEAKLDLHIKDCTHRTSG